jgi:TPR repeat protein
VSCQRDNEARTVAVRRIDKDALEYHDRACLFGDAEACNKAGVTYAVESSAAPEDDAPTLASQAEVRFEKACKLGSKQGCRNVGSTRPAK